MATSAFPPAPRSKLFALLSLLALAPGAYPFAPVAVPRRRSASLAASAPPAVSELTSAVTTLKNVLAKEYATFFSPMYEQYYAPDVTFDDPLTSLAGVAGYRDNVDLLAGRTLLGGILFADAGIVLHGVDGGAVDEDGAIAEVTTRWTLRLTAKVLPWRPTATFSGVSAYTLVPNPAAAGPRVVVAAQTDYWDSANIVGPGTPGEGGRYGKVPKADAVRDFLGQLSPGAVEAVSAAPEVPFLLLRRGAGYEVRRYPAVAAAAVSYERRDLAYDRLGALTRGATAYAPAVMTVPDGDEEEKSMAWTVAFQTPGGPGPSFPEPVEKAAETQTDVELKILPERVVAVIRFDDATTPNVVRKQDAALREMLKRDGLVAPEESEGKISFAQFDAVYSMGQRRSEVWIDLEKHPW
uniref:SOUL heme-binding protein n=1 Tax=Corethron hystrix TaxID=216773 RepID=A0A7S1BSY6_9STRA|mmetsp:Transcript_3837/g.7233  ORF Transcript_3837/g.7233 Transcript_3837/m.7233 type:complete len:409 (+) Transcript_3837:203-1429(+)|eukprot:CAMPEP_0113312516 /NCGR_PEP_ID=MMETSP0010_2-20120614/9324_1 /TAXON_ID=216773 ORGANISM="Corethron hystrix, Strain 308" /NCGR_SAMPLE_ID=MMETSP0010_2 /ASSEMBLY_ACC=CAM_ASM_000155 /LENGTH=408 /DNA_ID=CAMNT_0000168375 /DNA_START=29 /DNA_END=1255 /DNA_ORIENTATION=+ /assembly_acc=CAM_ASM_000155